MVEVRKTKRIDRFIFLFFLKSQTERNGQQKFSSNRMHFKKKGMVINVSGLQPSHESCMLYTTMMQSPSEGKYIHCTQGLNLRIQNM